MVMRREWPRLAAIGRLWGGSAVGEAPVGTVVRKNQHVGGAGGSGNRAGRARRAMFRIDSGGDTPRYCDGISRRSFLQVGVAGMASVGLAGVARAVQGGDPGAKPKKDTSVILLWLDGGAGHMDTYDMKPDAPAEYRGIWHPIKTNVPGVEVTELFPLQ